MQTRLQLINFIHVVLFIMQISSNMFKSTCGSVGFVSSEEYVCGLPNLCIACFSLMHPIFHSHAVAIS